MIKEIKNDQWTLEALERLRLALGSYSDELDAMTIISLGATRINRLTEKMKNMKDIAQNILTVVG
jgi:hypothetical protein